MRPGFSESVLADPNPLQTIDIESTTPRDIMYAHKALCDLYYHIRVILIIERSSCGLTVTDMGH